MCGIIAILRRPSGRTAPPAPAILDALDRVLDTLRTTVPVLVRTGPAPLDEAARNLDGIDRSLRGTAGLAPLPSPPGVPVRGRPGGRCPPGGGGWSSVAGCSRCAVGRAGGPVIPRSPGSAGSGLGGTP